MQKEDEGDETVHVKLYMNEYNRLLDDDYIKNNSNNQQKYSLS